MKEKLRCGGQGAKVLGNNNKKWKTISEKNMTDNFP